MSEVDTLDLSGLKCPVPALRTKKHLARMKLNEIIRVICTDPLSELDIPFVVQNTGNLLLSQTKYQNGKYEFIIESLGGIKKDDNWPAG